MKIPESYEYTREVVLEKDKMYFLMEVIDILGRRLFVTLIDFELYFIVLSITGSSIN